MSEQHLEVLRRLYDAFHRRDMPAMLEIFDPDIEVSAPEGFQYAATMMRLLGPRFVVLLESYHGHDEGRRLYEAMWAISARFTVDPKEFVQHGEQVFVPVVLRAQTADGGIEGEAEGAHLWTLAGDRVTSLRVYGDRGRALAAISPVQGVEEE
jgi:ketosteroid isomerase-like protein